MNRSDLLLVSLGGAGNKLADAIMDTDYRYQGLFINTSITDLETLKHCNTQTKNFICISTQNGVGRNRSLGKSYAESYVMTIIEKILNYVQQDTIYLLSSLGGGSGSAILSVLLEKIAELKTTGEFDKTVNLICIIPDLKSPDVILKNSLNTWSETLRTSGCVNSMIFINNGTQIEGIRDIEKKEVVINEKFASLFDSVFEIPTNNGHKFDSGNLSNILKDKGCLYIYDLPSGYNNVIEAFKKSEQESILPSIYKSTKNTYVDEETGRVKLRCGYLGISLSDEEYNKASIEKNYIVRRELYVGQNDEKNLVLISGCLPPSGAMENIKMELDERSKRENFDDMMSFEEFVIDMADTSTNKDTTAKNASHQVPSQESQNKPLKKVMKKSLFKR